MFNKKIKIINHTTITINDNKNISFLALINKVIYIIYNTLLAFEVL